MENIRAVFVNTSNVSEVFIYIKNLSHPCRVTDKKISFFENNILHFKGFVVFNTVKSFLFRDELISITALTTYLGQKIQY